MKLGLLNTSILTVYGAFRYEPISLNQAKELVNSNELDSAVGHSSTAQVMGELLGIKVPVNRQTFQQRLGQQALVFKMDGRPPEGVILSREEIEEMGYSWGLLKRYE